MSKNYDRLSELAKQKNYIDEVGFVRADLFIFFESEEIAKNLGVLQSAAAWAFIQAAGDVNEAERHLRNAGYLEEAEQ